MHEDAFRAATHAAELNPASFAAQLSMMLAQAWACKYSEALAASVPVLQMSGRHPWALSVLAQVFAAQDDWTRAEAVHDELHAGAKSGYVQCTWLALSALALGRTDDAMELTFRSVVENDAFGPWFLRFPGTDALRTHPRYPELLRLVGGGRGDTRSVLAHNSPPKT